MPTNQLSELIQAELSALPKVARVWVGFSGGADSSALLHSALALKAQFDIAAIHVNHQLSPNASSWQEHCQSVAKKWGAQEIVVRQVQVGRGAGGPEQSARDARYGVFEQILEPDDVLLLGHHLQDQVETFFLRLARGTGPSGLRAMAAQRPWRGARIIRPFLALSKSALIDYLEQRELPWIEDESNRSEQYDRNFLRHSVMPALRQRWPHFEQQITRAIDHLSEQDAVLLEYVEADLRQLEPRRERVGCSIDLSGLLSFSNLRRNQLIRHWLQKLDFPMPSAKQLDQLEQFYTAKADAQPLLSFGQCEFRRFRSRLYCLAQNWQHSMLSERLALSRCLSEQRPPGSLELFPADAACSFVSEPGDLVSCFAWQDSIKRAHPSTRAHSQSIKKLMQEYAVEPWLRALWPIIVRDEQLVAVPGLWVERSFFVPDLGGNLDWRLPEPRP